MNTNKIALSIIALVLGLVVAAQFIESDFDIERQQDNLYCEMVDIYLSDPSPIEQRLGWPPYNSKIDCSGAYTGTSTAIARSIDTNGRGRK